MPATQPNFSREESAAGLLVRESAGDILEGASVAPGERRTITTDFTLASAEIRDTLAPARLDVGVGVETFGLHFDLRRFRSFGIELSLVSAGAAISLVAPPLRDHYVIAVPISGSVTVGTRSEHFVMTRTRGVVMGPDQPVFFTNPTSDCRQLCIRIAKADVTSALSRMLRRPVRQCPQFAFQLDVAAQRSRPLMQALEMAAVEVLEDGSTPARSVMASSISQLVINSLLLVQDHAYTQELNYPVDPDLPESLSIAQSFILEHLSDPIGVVDIAHAANLSVRALEQGFARHLGMPPTAYLRNLRLVRAHEELRRSTTEETSVRMIAEHWGFRHAGRFSSLYRESFGVSPSQELRARDTAGRDRP